MLKPEVSLTFLNLKAFRDGRGLKLDKIVLSRSATRIA